MDLAVRLACEGQLAVIMQQNAKQHAISNMRFGPMYSEVMGKISVAGLKQRIRSIGSGFAKTGIAEVCML